ncbi:MAG: hypothetical protein KTR31_18820 [Myxococcales bacterium]|nr:hypothetical protein [Myxococcales bacterium]
MWIALAVAGCTEALQSDVTRDVGDPDTPWTAEITPFGAQEGAVVLQLAPEDRERIELQMSRDEVAELLGSIAADIELLRLDPEILLRGALDQIRFACGDDWTNNERNTDYDCSLTPLGQSFGPDWDSTPEFAMLRLLTMTPNNADSDGTSLEGAANIADALGIGGGFDNVLADTLLVADTDLAVGNEAVVQILLTNLLATHPSLGADATIPVSLRDALTDLASLFDTLGPSGNHPGVVSAAPFGQVLADDFSMGLALDSHLQVLDGIDLSAGKGFLVRSDAPDPVSMDFEDPERFTLQGIVDGPVVDLQLGLIDDPTAPVACTVDPSCYDDLPGNPTFAGSVWHLDPWTIERIVAEAAWLEHNKRPPYEQTYRTLLFVPAVTVQLGTDGTPPAWARMTTLLDLGDPPDDQYLWDLLLEVAQQNLHSWDTYELAEGTANPIYALQDVPTGLTAGAVEAQVRSAMAKQSSEIAHALFGNYRDNSDPVDLVFARDAEGAPALQFVSALDRNPEGTPTHAVSGFFSDPELTQRVSRPKGDRQVWVPPTGVSTVYAQDDAGDRFRLDVHFEGPEADQISVVVMEAM